jgi:trigger factor
MKVKEKKLGDQKLLLSVEASASEVNKVLQDAQVDFANSMGLRPQEGKTVAEVALDQMGIKNLDSVVEGKAVEFLVPLALDKKNIIPAYPPKPQPKSPFGRNHEFKFDIEVDLKPEYELTSYEPVDIKVEKFVFDDSAIDKQIAEMAGRFASYETDSDASSDEPVVAGDNIKIAIEAFDNGERMTNLSTEGRPYTAGQGYMPDGFENEVLGMKVGETKSFSFEGPDFDEDFNETTKTFEATVTVLERQKRVEPEINDEWVHQNMPMYKDLAELKHSIGSNLERQSRDQYDAYVQQLAAAEAAKRFEGRIADEIYESMRDQIVSNLRQELKQNDTTWEQFIEQNGGEQQASMLIMMQTRQMLVQGFSLDSVFRHEGLVLNDEDIEAACHAMNPQVNPKRLRQELEQNGRGFVLRETAERLKANKYLVDHANITYTD